MTSFIIVAGGVGVMCLSGFAVSTALKWFLSYDLNIENIGKKGERDSSRPNSREVNNRARIDNIGKKLQSRG